MRTQQAKKTSEPDGGSPQPKLCVATPDTKSFLHKYVTEITKARLIKHCRGALFRLEEGLPEPATGAYAAEMSVIMLWGMMGSFVFKTHFDLAVATRLAAQGLDKKENDISPDMARDFMREFSNVQAGHMRGVFEASRVLLGMSLPFLALGPDEAIFRKIRDPRAGFSAWRLLDGDSIITGTAEICLLDLKPIEGIRGSLEKDIASISAADASNDGDVQFF